MGKSSLLVRACAVAERHLQKAFYILTDFTPEEAGPLALGLKGTNEERERALQRILY